MVYFSYTYVCVSQTKMLHVHLDTKQHKSWLIVSRCIIDKLVNVVEFMVNEIQTLVNVIKISGVDISLKWCKGREKRIDRRKQGELISLVKEWKVERNKQIKQEK